MRQIMTWLIAAGCACTGAHASLTLSSGLGTTHAGNLVTNGSFELGAPADGIANAINWADPSSPPYAVPPTWTSSGPGSSTLWGNDGPSPYRLKFSDVLPDGRAAVLMKTTTNTFVTQAPTFLPNGRVTFAAAPSFLMVAPAPVLLSQSVPTNLSPSASYKMSFWVSGEENATNQGNTGLGLIGLQVTNVLAGDPIQYLAVPNAITFGMSKLYEFTFVPLNPLLPVNITFYNWGGLNLAPYGGSPFGTQPILDDVIINGAAAPAPATILVLTLAGIRGRRGTRTSAR